MVGGTGAGGTLEKTPMLDKEYNRLDKAVDTLSAIVSELRDSLDIANINTVAEQANILSKSAPQHRVEIRGRKFESLAERLEYQTSLLSSVLDAVREI